MTDMVEFRKNWWSHVCYGGQKTWKHKQYMQCDRCKADNGKKNVTKTTL